MAHMWFMHDALLGCALFFLDMLAEYTLLSMTVMVTPCLWYVVLRTPRSATEPRKGPTWNFHEKYQKIPPGPKFWTPRIYPQNTPKIPKEYPKKMVILVFFWYFLGVPEFRPEGYFFGIFCGSSESGHLGAL